MRLTSTGGARNIKPSAQESNPGKEKRAGAFAPARSRKKRKNSVATNVLPVDPNLVVITPRPMSWYPDPSMPMAPVIRAMVIVRPITDFDKDTRRFRSGHRSERACAEQNAQQDHQISFHIVF